MATRNYDFTRVALYDPESRQPFQGLDNMPAFERDAAGFGLGIAWWLANACHLAYLEAHQLAPYLVRAGWTLEAFLSGPSTQTLVISGPGHAIVAFRGAEVIAMPDVWHALDMRLAQWDGDGAGSVHRGFMVALDEVWTELVGVLDRLAARRLPVWYAGYSLGAGLAVLAAARRRPRATYTYGAPRIGDQAFAQYMADQAIYRVVNEADIVPNLPMRRWGYRHVGRLFFLDEERGLCREPFPAQTAAWRAQAVARYQRTMPWLDPRRTNARRFADHGIINYAVGLGRAISCLGGPCSASDAVQDRSCELS